MIRHAATFYMIRHATYISILVKEAPTRRSVLLGRLTLHSTALFSKQNKITACLVRPRGETHVASLKKVNNQGKQETIFSSFFSLPYIPRSEIRTSSLLFRSTSV